MAWDVTRPTNSERLGVSPGLLRANFSAIETCIGSAKLAAGTVIVDPIPSGGTFKTWIYVDTAPSGWTIDGTPSDELLAIKGGATYTTGGTTAGTWTQPDHVLTEAEMAAHTHFLLTDESIYPYVYPTATKGIARRSAQQGWYEGAIASGTTGTSSTLGLSSSVGSDTAHNHGTTYRPAARVGIIASAD